MNEEIFTWCPQRLKVVKLTLVDAEVDGAIVKGKPVACSEDKTAECAIHTPWCLLKYDQIQTKGWKKE